MSEQTEKARRRAFVFEEIDFMIDRVNRAAIPGCRNDIKYHTKSLRKLLKELKESELS